MEDRGRDDRYRAGSLRDFWIGPGLAGASPLGGGATPGRPTKAPACALKALDSGRIRRCVWAGL